MSNLKDDIYGKVTGDMDPFRRILSKVPGFQGYIERNNRRDSDKLLRDVIYKRLKEQEDRLSALQREFIDQGQIEDIDKLERSAIKIRTFADRVHTAPRGYAGLFDAVKVNEAELGRLYEFDASLLDLADQIGRAIDNVQASAGTDGLPAAIRNLEGLTRQCIETYDKRDEVIKSIS